MEITDELVLLWFVEEEEKLYKIQGIILNDIISLLKKNPKKIKDAIESNLLKINKKASIYFNESISFSPNSAVVEIIFSFYKKYFLNKEKEIVA